MSAAETSKASVGLTRDEDRLAVSLMNGEPMKVVILFKPGEQERASKMREKIERDPEYRLRHDERVVLREVPEIRPTVVGGFFQAIGKMFNREGKGKT